MTCPGVAERAASGCGGVIHLAANTSQHFQPYARYAEVNVEGTRLVIGAAVRQGVRRFVYVSSANTLGYGSLELPGTETDRIRYPFTRSRYATSKLAAEALVLRTARACRMEVVVVNPCFLIGAYDSKPGSGRILLRALGRRLVWTPPGGKNFIGARDAAKAIIRALSDGEAEQRYLLGADNLSYLDFYRRVRGVTRERFGIVVIPAPVLKAIGVIGSLLAHAGFPNAFHLNNMRILCVKNYYSANKAGVHLNLSPAPIEVAIAEATAWFRHQGMTGTASAVKTNQSIKAPQP
jgi:nucleoside-diphosphate-sugar epimerase